MSLAGPLLVACLLLVPVVTDLGGYVRAAATAQAAADATAAATAIAAGPGGRRAPRTEAHRIAAMNSGRLESCVCAPGAARVTVEVSVPVEALVATRFGPRRVTARASARLVPRR